MPNLTPQQRQQRYQWSQDFLQLNGIPLAGLFWELWQHRGPGHLLLYPTLTQINYPHWFGHSSPEFAAIQPKLTPATLQLITGCNPETQFAAVVSFINIDGLDDEYLLRCTPSPPPPACAAAVKARPEEWQVTQWPFPVP